MEGTGAQRECGASFQHHSRSGWPIPRATRAPTWRNSTALLATRSAPPAFEGNLGWMLCLGKEPQPPDNNSPRYRFGGTRRGGDRVVNTRICVRNRLKRGF